MLRELSISPRSFPLVAPFRIARGVRHVANVVMVELHQTGNSGRGECTHHKHRHTTTDGLATTRMVDADPIEIKVDADDPAARIHATRQATPDAGSS